MTEQTVDSLIDQALSAGLIKNKTEGKKLKKAGLLQLLSVHNTPDAILANVEGPPPLVELLAQHEDAILDIEATPSKVAVLTEKDIQDWPIRHVKALESQEFPQVTTEDLLTPEGPATHLEVPEVSNRAADNILLRYSNHLRAGRGGERRDRAKAKAARKARKINRRNHK